MLKRIVFTILLVIVVSVNTSNASAILNAYPTQEQTMLAGIIDIVQIG